MADDAKAEAANQKADEAEDGEESGSDDSDDGGGGGSGGGGGKLPLILGIVNTLVVLGAIGTLYYTKFVFKRPSITEENERARLEEEHKKNERANVTPGYVVFEPITVNIESMQNPSRVETAPDGGGSIQGRLHYATVGFSLEIRDIDQKALIDRVRPILMDRLLGILGRKKFNDLTTVQGRYVIRAQIQDIANRLTADLPSMPAAPKVAAGGHGGGHGAPAATAEHGGGGGEHGAPPAAEHGGGGEHGAPAADHGGGHGGGGEPGATAKAHAPEGPPISQLFHEGLVANVFFTQFTVQ